ncbi:MAG TPA: Ig-like domain-containing protein, partial [Bacilli bacterium]|nr:Ig-like domain-containing protein [Bacilli bacterium]HQQ39062.1 Ig-like domain-containing protein [Bacilli bacterium]
MEKVLKLLFLLFIALFLVSCKDEEEPEEESVTTLTLTTKNLTLEEEETKQIEAVAKTDKGEAVAITYEVADPTVASVDSTGKVTGIKKGSTTITLKANDKTDTCNVTVTEKEVVDPPIEPKVTFSVSEVTIDLDANPEYTLKPKLVGEAELLYAIDKPEIISIEGNKITALKTGTAIVTATYGKSTATVTVNVVKQFIVS